MIVTEKIGGMDVLHSGSIHIYGEEGYASIMIDNTLTLEFKFKTKKCIPVGRINFNGISNKMTLTFYNFFSSSREGPTEPIKIGSVGSKSLYISLFVFTYKNRIRIINYCLLNGE